jgi:hypothetical protein
MAKERRLELTKTSDAKLRFWKSMMTTWDKECLVWMSEACLLSAMVTPLDYAPADF